MMTCKFVKHFIKKIFLSTRVLLHYHHRYISVQFPIKHVCSTLSGMKIIFSDRRVQSSLVIQWLCYPYIIYPNPTGFLYLLSNSFAKPNLYKVILIFFSIFYNKLFFSLNFLDYTSMPLSSIHLFSHYFLSVYYTMDTFPMFCSCPVMIDLL